MHTTAYSLALVYVTAALWITFLINAEESSTSGSKKYAAEFENITVRKNCRKVMTRMGKRVFKVLGKCTRDMRSENNYTDDEFQERIQCTVKCALQREELINSEGQVTKHTVQVFMDKLNVPDYLQKMGHDIIEECMKEYEKIFDPNDEFCISYGNFTKCCQNTLADWADSCSGEGEGEGAHKDFGLPS